METGAETWKIRLEKFQVSFYKSVYVDENAKQELLFDLLQVNNKFACFIFIVIS